ncbi:hypothetical protein KR067_000445 [Drosophila pandora]|nr:hypothetical protein KR067_000445 [Drosophila pandora]
MAKMIRLHLQNVRVTVITHRRRAHQKARRRRRMLRSFFMQKMSEMQANYLEMFAMLRLKQARAEDEAAEEEQEEDESAEEQQHCEDGETAEVQIVETNMEPSRLFFEDIIPELSEEEFLNTLHVSRGTFETLCKQLTPSLRNMDVLARRVPAVAPEKCVALALYFLASGKRLSQIAIAFSMARNRTIKCLKAFCNAVMSTLGRALRQLPQSRVDCNSVAKGFHRESNMPAALVGVLGVCSIPIRASVEPKSRGTVLRMEYLLDDRMRFRQLQLGCGKPPRVPLFSITPNKLTALPNFYINSHPVPAFVLAPVDQNYPLKAWLLQRYKEPTAPHEHDFNEVAEHLHEMSDCALHRLVSRWNFLNQPLDISFHTASCIITAAAVLHNLLEELSEPYMLEWGNSVDVSKFRAEPLVGRATTEDVAGLEARDFIARTISSTEI